MKNRIYALVSTRPIPIAPPSASISAPVVHPLRTNVSMVVNRVPKFVEQQIAKRRRDAKNGVSSEESRPKKFTSFDAARKKFQETRNVIEERQKEREQKEEKLKVKKKERKQVGKLVNKRNERGQPNMNSQLELLMKRFGKTE